MPHGLDDTFADTFSTRTPGRMQTIDFDKIVMGDVEPTAGEPLTLWDAFVENRGTISATFSGALLDGELGRLVRWLFLTAHEDNSLNGIFWGGRNTLAAAASRISFPPIFKGETVRILAARNEIIDLGSIKVDVVTTGDILRFVGGREPMSIDFIDKELLV